MTCPGGIPGHRAMRQAAVLLLVLVASGATAGAQQVINVVRHAGQHEPRSVDVENVHVQARPPADDQGRRVQRAEVNTQAVNTAAQFDPQGRQINSDFGRLALPTDEARQIELSLKYSFGPGGCRDGSVRAARAAPAMGAAAHARDRWGEPMNRRTFMSMAALPALVPLRPRAQARKTEVSIRGDAFYINGRPTYAGRTFNGKRVEGLLMNIRVVQGIFDDLNPETASRWVYPDTKRWDPERNTNEFVAAMPEWKRHGVLAFTINLQGGSPGFSGGRGRGGRGTPAAQAPDGPPVPPPATAAAQTPPPGEGRGAGAEGRAGGRGPTGPQLENSAIDPEGNLRPAYMARLRRILDRADELGMVAIVGYFYFGQDQRLKDESAVRRAVLNATNWILDAGYRNVLVEVNNECNISYDHEILQPARVPELIRLVQSQTRDGRRLLVSTSFGGTNSRGPREHPDTPVTSGVARQSDFLLIHGNGPNDPALIRRCIAATRGLAGRTVPVMINEDPNFHFTEPDNHLLASIDEYTSWGYYDQGQNNYQDGFQSPPVNWTINTGNKRQFFELVKKITGV